MARGRHRPRRRRRPREHRRPGGQLRVLDRLVGRGALAALLLVALVAGLPWGLCRYAWWPLPDHIWAGREAAASLTAPLRASLLHKVVACTLWATWLVCVGGVLRAAGEGLRRAAGGRRPAGAGGPLKVMAAALLGAAALALLPSRGPQAHLAAQKRQITAGAPGDAAPPPEGQDGSDAAAPRENNRAAVVRPPRNGVHDSLWRIADRHLHDGDRWPEIYALNYGRRQADGHALRDPGLIRPGWVLRLPAPRPDPGDEPERGHPPAPPTRPAPPSKGAGTPPSPVTPSSPSPQPPSDTGLHLPEGVFIGAGTATVLAAALLLARRRRRVRSRPGRSAQQAARFAPVIRALRQAGEQHPPRTAAAADPAKAPRLPAAPAGEAAGDIGRDDPEGARITRATPHARVLGVKDGQDLAWDLARSRGLGLVGPGAPDAARALLIDLLSQPRPEGAAEAELVMTAPDAERLLGRHAAEAPSRRLHLVADLPRALQLLETELLSRTRARSGDGTALVPSTGTSQIVLIAAVPAEEQRRLQAILDNGSALGLAGVLIGQWRAGGTLRIRRDGTVGAASPSHAETFAGARLFTVPPEPAAAILDLLAEAAPEQSGKRQSDQDTNTAHTEPEPRTDTPEGPPPPPDAHKEEAPAARTPSTTAPPEDTEPDRRSRRPDQPIRIGLLGRIAITYRAPGAGQGTDITSGLAPKQRELLAYLAVHRDGVQREALTAAIWPQAPYARPSNAFHATLSQLRRSLRQATHGVVLDIVRRADKRYRLDEQQVSADLWELKDEVQAARTSENQDERQAALRRVIGLYTGDFTNEVAGEWQEEPRESLRREYLDSVSALVRLVRDTDPNRALDLLEQARERDRYNEALYRDIARIQAQLQEHDAIPRTLELLKRSLAELDQLPSAVTLRHFEALQAPGQWNNSPSP
ncbi:hypothetical protein ABZ916_24490 [Streptomyces sp. NPDC046853]|uniref:hypothetical protein n=1 Tax=Streptomyces sp. NPDC046853 TaxID=3154920 RepID=UPI00340BCB8C